MLLVDVKHLHAEACFVWPGHEQSEKMGGPGMRRGDEEATVMITVGKQWAPEYVGVVNTHAAR